MTTNAELIGAYQNIIDSIETARGRCSFIESQVNEALSSVLALIDESEEIRERIAAVNDGSSNRLSEAEGAMGSTIEYLGEDAQALRAIADYVMHRWMPGMTEAQEKVSEQLAVTVS